MLVKLPGGDHTDSVQIEEWYPGTRACLVKRGSGWIGKGVDAYVGEFYSTNQAVQRVIEYRGSGNREGGGLRCK